MKAVMIVSGMFKSVGQLPRDMKALPKLMALGCFLYFDRPPLSSAARNIVFLLRSGP